MSCQPTGKTEFRSRRAARRALHAIVHPQGRMHVYRCGDHWHFGHNDKLDRRRFR